MFKKELLVTGIFLLLFNFGSSTFSARSEQDEFLVAQTAENCPTDVNLTEWNLNIRVDCWLKVKQPEILKNLERGFTEAVKDAFVAQSGEEVNNLKPLLIGGKDAPDTGYLVVAWIGEKEAESLQEKIETNQNKHIFKTRDGNNKYVWVTAVPQLREFCHNCKGTGLQLPGNLRLQIRLMQYLGLKLSQQKSHFLEIWVNKKDLFRPCKDEEIEDQSCELPDKTDRENFSRKHIIGSEKLIDPSWPWTALGYTYDWASVQGKPIEIGASEFVIQPGAEVELVSIKKTEDYCANQYLK